MNGKTQIRAEFPTFPRVAITDSAQDAYQKKIYLELMEFYSSLGDEYNEDTKRSMVADRAWLLIHPENPLRIRTNQAPTDKHLKFSADDMEKTQTCAPSPLLNKVTNHEL